MKFSGFLLKESLEDLEILEALTITQVAALPCPEHMRSDDLPAVWTGVNFEGEAAAAQSIADRLSQALKARAWFCDLHTDRDNWLIFSGQVVKFPRVLGSDHQPWPEEAKAAARRVGTPGF
ncbi:MAG: hypothetical protein JWM32_1252 [Verrucomicrobia bacterium]|nr:hypothetical protein [Verrucomicrobiota bacterium]